MGSADAVAREAAWLAAFDPNDGLPALLKTVGGPFQVVQGYSPRTTTQQATGLYLRRSSITDMRYAQQQRLARYAFSIKAIWPLAASAATGAAETAQSDFDSAIELVIRRIRGLVADHTHGGRFLSVAEAPGAGEIAVAFADPEQTVPQGFLRADITYSADDSLVIV